MINHQTIEEENSYRLYPLRMVSDQGSDDKAPPGYYFPMMDTVEFRVSQDQFAFLTDNGSFEDIEDCLNRVVRHELGHVSLSKRTNFWDQLFFYNSSIAFDIMKTVDSYYNHLVEQDFQPLDELIKGTGGLYEMNKVELALWRPIQESYASIAEAYASDKDTCDYLSALQAEMAVRISKDFGVKTDRSLDPMSLIEASSSEKRQINHQYVYEVLKAAEQIFEVFGSENERDALLTIRRLARMSSHPGVDLEDWYNRGPVQFIETVKILSEMAERLPRGRGIDRGTTPDEIALHITAILGHPKSTPETEESVRESYLENAISNTVGSRIGQPEVLRTSVYSAWQGIIMDTKPSIIVIRERGTNNTTFMTRDVPPIVIKNMSYSVIVWLLFESIHEKENYFQDSQYIEDLRMWLNPLDKAVLLNRTSDYIEHVEQTGRYEELSEAINESVRKQFA